MKSSWRGFGTATCAAMRAGAERAAMRCSIVAIGVREAQQLEAALSRAKFTEPEPREVLSILEFQ